jgi:type II secretory pathway pseudopilin PulG
MRTLFLRLVWVALPHRLLVAGAVVFGAAGHLWAITTSDVRYTAPARVNIPPAQPVLSPHLLPDGPYALPPTVFYYQLPEGQPIPPSLEWLPELRPTDAVANTPEPRPANRNPWAMAGALLGLALGALVSAAWLRNRNLMQNRPAAGGSSGEKPIKQIMAVLMCLALGIAALVVGIAADAGGYLTNEWVIRMLVPVGIILLLIGAVVGTVMTYDLIRKHREKKKREEEERRRQQQLQRQQQQQQQQQPQQRPAQAPQTAPAQTPQTPAPPNGGATPSPRVLTPAPNPSRDRIQVPAPEQQQAPAQQPNGRPGGRY